MIIMLDGQIMSLLALMQHVEVVTDIGASYEMVGPM